MGGTKSGGPTTQPTAFSRVNHRLVHSRSASAPTVHSPNSGNQATNAAWSDSVTIKNVTTGEVLLSTLVPYDPNATNLLTGIVYHGTVTIGPVPVPAAYSSDMRMVTVGLNWKTGSLNRSRSFTTYIARNGLQTYIY